jgi:hypothetical protein
VAGRANTWCWVESRPLSALDTWTPGTVGRAHATPRNFCNSGPAQPEVLMTSPPQPWLQLRVSKHHTHSQVSNLETPVFPARGRPMRLVGFEVVRLCGVVSLTSVSTSIPRVQSWRLIRDKPFSYHNLALNRVEWYGIWGAGGVKVHLDCGALSRMNYFSVRSTTGRKKERNEGWI